mgnify:CR=1 FL=1
MVTGTMAVYYPQMERRSRNNEGIGTSEAPSLQLNNSPQRLVVR